MARLPNIKQIRHLVTVLKREIVDEYRASEEDNEPSMSLTVGWSDKTGEWSYQTGDNSYSGGAYNYPHWAVVSLYRNTNSLDTARDIQSQLIDLSC